MILKSNSLVGGINYQVKGMVDANIKEDILQSAVSSIESTKNLKMNLHPDVTLEKILQIVLFMSTKREITTYLRASLVWGIQI